MTAAADAIADLSEPADAAREVARLNDLLSRERTIPSAVQVAVREIATAVTRTAVASWEAVDPRQAVIVLRAVVAAQEAIEDPESPEARDRLRIALESIRQACASIAEGEPVADERSPKEIVQWLVGTTEVPQARLAALIGVSARQFQRWASAGEAAQPEGEDARRVRAIARIVNQLRFVLTPGGTIDWFDWPRDDLGGQKPAELLRQSRYLPELTAAAGSMRGTYVG